MNTPGPPAPAPRSPGDHDQAPTTTLPAGWATADLNDLTAAGWTTEEIRGLAHDWPITDPVPPTVVLIAAELTISTGLSPTETRAWLQALFSPNGQHIVMSAAHEDAYDTDAFRSTEDIVTSYRNAARGDNTLAVAAMRAGLTITALAEHHAAGTADITALNTLAALNDASAPRTA